MENMIQFWIYLLDIFTDNFSDITSESERSEEDDNDS